MVTDETLAQQEFDSAEIAISVPGDLQWVEIVHFFVELNRQALPTCPLLEETRHSVARCTLPS